MKLLIVTQVVDSEHSVLGFFHRWIEEFSKHCETVHVICLEVGKQSLPTNVHVHSLGKESGAGRLAYLWRFYKYSWQLRKEYDAVFVHMVPIYVLIGAPLWRWVLRKKVGLWYVHRQVNLQLRLAVWLSQVVYTSVPESMRVETSKVQYVGHGMDLDSLVADNDKKTSDSILKVAHIGRIAPIKNLQVLIEAITVLQQNYSVRVELYGVSRTKEEKEFEEKLRKKVRQHKLEEVVIFCGGIQHADLPNMLVKQDITVNLTPTGGLDKSVIESAVLGVPVITSNTAYERYFGESAQDYIINLNDSAALASALEKYATRNPIERSNESEKFKLLAKQFDLSVLVPKLLAGLKKRT